MERVANCAMLLVQVSIHKELCVKRAHRESIRLQIEVRVRIVRMAITVTEANVYDVSRENSRMTLRLAVTRAN